MNDSLRVLLCDDTDQVRVLLKAEMSLEPDIVIVGEASNGEEAVELARAAQPDVVVLDLSMPVMDGLEALPHLKEVAPAARIIMLSTSEVSEMASKAVEAGASRYIEKGTPAHDIVDAVRDRGGLSQDD